MGWNLLGKCGKGFVETPNLDRLAEEGINFQRAYTTCPLCAPARAGLFTGQFPSEAGTWGNDLAPGITVKTMGQYFQKAGYHTVYTGKWHLDGTDYFGTGICPEGYDPKYWYDGRNYLDDLTDEQAKKWRSGYNNAEDIKRDGITRADTWAGRITDRCLDLLQNDAEEPFLLVASYDEPHGPSLCPSPFCDMYTNKPYPFPENYFETFNNKPIHQKIWAENSFYLRKDYCENQNGLEQPLYFGAASFIDDEIGKILGAIDQKCKDNTIVIFTTDHGHYLGAHKLDTKGPAFYEEVTRVPLIIRHPESAFSGKDKRLISHIDLLPTLLKECGLSVPPILQGKEHTEYFRDPNSEGSKEVYIEFNRFGNSHDSWFGLFPIRSIVTQQYKLTLNLFTSDELYDLALDPGEMDNLIHSHEHQTIVEELHRKILHHMNTVRDPFRGSVWDMGFRETGIKWMKGERRVRPYDGWLPIGYNYETGRPDKER